MNKNLRKKLKESLLSVLPISAVVLVLHFTIAPLPLGTLALFLTGMVLLVFGMGLFTLGADLSMMQMGERIGAYLTMRRKPFLLACTAFLIGMMITVAEPDLQVLARQVPGVPDLALVLAVALGVGIFLVVALLRIVFQIPLPSMLALLYLLSFGIAAFSSPDFLSVAFDSGGVTTGPITVPFILALGIGVAAVRGGASAHDDSFGLVALCSVGPIMAVLILGIFYDTSSSTVQTLSVSDISSFQELLRLFLEEFPKYFKEVGAALLPILLFFLGFQIFCLQLPRTQVIKIMVGLVYTYLGLVLFLTGVNVGFMQAGSLLGKTLAMLDYGWIIVPVGMAIGFFVVAAEPAVHVLNKQVEEITAGAIPCHAMMAALSIGLSISLGLAMIRVLTGLNIWYFLLPGYAAALGLSFFVPRIFTAIAFDSGGVASGPMTATFLLPFAMGACEAVGGNLMRDAFGIVAMVAMTPLVTIQLLGLVFALKTRHPADVLSKEAQVSEDEIIEL